MFFLHRKHKPPHSPWLKVLLLSNGLILWSGAMMGPIYALFVDEIGGDILDAGIAAMAFSLAAGFVVLAAGRLSDRENWDREVVLVGFAVISLGFLGFIFVSAMWHLLVVQVVIGLGEAIYSPAFDSLYSKHLDQHHEAQEWGWWEAVYYFVTAGAAVVGGFIVEFAGWDALFLTMGGLGWLSVVVLFVSYQRLLK